MNPPTRDKLIGIIIEYMYYNGPTTIKDIYKHLFDLPVATKKVGRNHIIEDIFRKYRPKSNKIFFTSFKKDNQVYWYIDEYYIKNKPFPEYEV